MQGGDEEKKYEVFLKDLKADNACRWAVYDFEYELEGGKRNKLILISWLVPRFASGDGELLTILFSPG